VVPVCACVGQEPKSPTEGEIYLFYFTCNHGLTVGPVTRTVGMLTLSAKVLAVNGASRPGNLGCVLCASLAGFNPCQLKALPGG